MIHNMGRKFLETCKIVEVFVSIMVGLWSVLLLGWLSMYRLEKISYTCNSWGIYMCNILDLHRGFRTIGWLIDCVKLIYLPLTNLSLTWKRHYYCYEGCKILIHAWRLWYFSRKGSLSCRSCCDTESRFFQSHPKNHLIQSLLILKIYFHYCGFQKNNAMSSNCSSV
jgi:hypothetical protein